MILLVMRTPERPAARVEAGLRARLAAGEWKPGEQLPTVRQLAESYGVGRETVARAIRRLADDGLVRLVDRWGIFASGESQGT